MTRPRSIRLSLVAPSGAGKSSAAGILRTIFRDAGLSCEVVKLAAPLYRLAHHHYAEAGVVLGAGTQDRLLMETIACSMRRISSTALLEPFTRQVRQSDADVLINDDLRDPTVDWPGLLALDFRIIALRTDPALRQARLAGRGDIAAQAFSPVDQALAAIDAADVVDNNGSLIDLRRALESIAHPLIEEWARA